MLVLLITSRMIQQAEIVDCPKDIKALLDAVKDCNMPGSVCWNSTGDYEELKKALKINS